MGAVASTKWSSSKIGMEGKVIKAPGEQSIIFVQILLHYSLQSHSIIQISHNCN